jgi:hypothetical protein
MKSSSAGKGTPYWYEWTVGLIKVVEMLYPESGISTVSFQEAGIKGWDDVVVRYTDGRTEYIQVKHTREGANITFGSFLSVDEEGVCLLESLYGAWGKMKLTSANATCTIYTNREAGERTFEGKPPLLKFIVWLKAEISAGKTLANFAVPSKWEDGWVMWLAKMNSGTDDERLDFLRALSIQTDQPDLEALQAEVQQRLADAFGASFAKAAPLLHAYNDALKRWTDTHAHVTADDAFEALVLPGDLEIFHPAPPPPAPFFPTRDKDAHDIERCLVDPKDPPVIFLSAAPGAGKTSVLSRIELRRTDRALSGIVGLRYFAFRPITPDSSLIPADADYYVKPERLWFSLLSQLRNELSGRLAKYRVPIRNNLLVWQDARNHVLRLAHQIGTEIGRRFVIVVDGIDHAARAGRARYNPEIARDFFASLPGPEELSDKQIRLLVAGQPAEHYPEYPSWLRTPSANVQKLDLGPLGKSDIAELLKAAALRMPHAEWDETVEVITSAAKGNTLSVVFAVEEAKGCSSVQELQLRLQDRALREGLQAYYESIWKYAFANLPEGNAQIGIEAALAGTLSLVRERISGEFLATAFPALDLTAAKWHLILANLGPLVVSEEKGFRVLHNDVRVFLTAYLAGRPNPEKKWICSALADFYLRPTSDRRAAHASLMLLLRDSDRQLEWARIFTVRWVFEAAAHDVPFDDVWRECELALRAGAKLRDWDVMHELACATETLGRWQDRSESSNSEPAQQSDNMAPFFPPSELTILPFESWGLNDLAQVCHDVERILSAGELPRAIAVLERWFNGVMLGTLGDKFFEEQDEQFRGNWPDDKSAVHVFTSLGEACRAAGYQFEPGANSNKRQNKAHFYFEQGWIKRSCSLGLFTSLKLCFHGIIPNYFSGCALAIRRLAESGNWRLVGRLLKLGYPNRSKFPEEFQLLAPLFCLRAGVQRFCPGWFDALKEAKINFGQDFQDTLEVPLSVCLARGWLEPSTHPTTIARQVFDKSDQTKRHETCAPQFLLLFRTAAVLGRFSALQSKGKLDAARDIFRPSEIQELAVALWGDGIAQSRDFHWHRSVAGELALKLVRAFFPLSSEHAKVLIASGRPTAERWLGDYRFESLWELFRLAGERELLRKWIWNILGPDGWLWFDNADSRQSTAEQYLPLARELGENVLADEVEKRLRWFRISYRGHKDYSFGWPTIWFKRLAKIEPTCIRDVGFLYLSLCEACSAQGDNRERWDVNTAIGSAAFAAGPKDVHQLMLADQPSCGTDEWLDQAVARFVNGSVDQLSYKPALASDEVIVIWCIAVGMNRWFDGDDVSGIADLRAAILSLKLMPQQPDIRSVLTRLTPGEAVRMPRPSTEHGQTPEKAKASPDEWRERLKGGNGLPPKEALFAIRELVLENENQHSLEQVLEAVGSKGDYSGAWHAHDELTEIARLVPDSCLWFLVESAIRPAGKDAYWWQTVAENLQSVILARASLNGATRLRIGLNRVLEMHELWARGGDKSLPLPIVQPSSGATANTWDELAVQSFALLFSSRFATVLEAAFTGMNALVSYRPDIIPVLFETFKGDDWKMQWLLTEAEVWALKFPSDLMKSKKQLDEILGTGKLRLRLQAWIVLSLLARRTGTSKPNFAFRSNASATSDNQTKDQADRILYTEAQAQGNFRLVDRFESARGTIERVEATTGLDFSDVERRVAPQLLLKKAMRAEEMPWKQRIRNRNDSFCVGEETADALDDAFDDSLSITQFSEGQLQRFAQAYLHSEDGWVLRQTPVPYPSLDRWPDSDTLAGRYEDPPSSRDLRSQFRLLASEQGIADDEIVIGAKLRAFSWREDFDYCCWWQEADASDGSPPTTLSGRSFPWMFGASWWEPTWVIGRRPISFFTGGQMHLLRCGLDIVPSRLWISLFGWTPHPENPLAWIHEDRIVARFEISHGPLNSPRSHAARQPVLHRWIIKRDAWQRVLILMPKLQWREQFGRVKSNAER